MTQDLDAVAAQAGLGEFRGTFRPTRPLTWGERTTGGKVTLVIGLTIVIGILGVIIVAICSANLVAGLVVAAVLLGFFWLARFGAQSRARANVGRELRFYEQGVAVVGTGGATVTPYRWEDMSVLQNITKHYRNGVYTHTTYVYTLSGPGVETTKVTGGTVGTFEQPDTWGSAIQQQVTAAQLPPALATVRAGLPLEFGPFSVSAERLSSAGKSVAWAEVQAIKTEKGFLSVKQQGRWLNMTTRAVSRIPNFFVFRTLADHLVESARNPR